MSILRINILFFVPNIYVYCPNKHEIHTSLAFVCVTHIEKIFFLNLNVKELTVRTLDARPENESGCSAAQKYTQQDIININIDKLSVLRHMMLLLYDVFINLPK